MYTCWYLWEQAFVAVVTFTKGCWGWISLFDVYKDCCMKYWCLRCSWVRLEISMTERIAASIAVTAAIYVSIMLGVEIPLSSNLLWCELRGGMDIDIGVIKITVRLFLPVLSFTSVLHLHWRLGLFCFFFSPVCKTENQKVKWFAHTNAYAVSSFAVEVLLLVNSCPLFFLNRKQ